MRLLSEVIECYEHARIKHDLSNMYTINTINRMTNYEFLQELSSALDNILKEKQDVRTNMD